jgi:AcrR family transcriptional regulator
MHHDASPSDVVEDWEDWVAMFGRSGGSCFVTDLRRNFRDRSSHRRARSRSDRSRSFCALSSFPPVSKPPPTEPRKQPRQARSRALVEAILDATERVLAHEGCEHATTTRVAEIAGVSVGSLYQYFPSREALLAAVIERRVERDERELASRMAALGDDASLAAVIRAGACYLVEVYRREPELYRTMVDEMDRVAREARVQAMIDDAIARTVAMLTPHREALGHDDLELAAYTIVTAQVAVVRDAVHRRPELLEGPRLADVLGTLAVRFFGLE